MVYHCVPDQRFAWSPEPFDGVGTEECDRMTLEWMVWSAHLRVIQDRCGGEAVRQNLAGVFQSRCMN